MQTLMRNLAPIVSPFIVFTLLVSSTMSIAQTTFDVATNNLKTGLYQNEIKKDKLARASLKRQYVYSNLFDGELDTTYTPKTSTLIEQRFEKAGDLSRIEVYGRSDYELSLEYKVNGLWQKAEGLQSIDLQKIDKNEWHSISLKEKVETKTVRLQLLPKTTNPNGLAELKFVYADNTVVKTKHSKVPVFGSSEQLTNIVEFASKQSRAVLGANFGKHKDNRKDNQFTINQPYYSEQISKAILSYQVKGLSGAASVIRSVNDSFSQGGLLIQNKKAQKAVQIVEEINPANLVAGTNLIRFAPHQKQDSHLPYLISDIKLTLHLGNAVEQLSVSEVQKDLRYQGKAYIRGFVAGDSRDIKSVTINDELVPFTTGQFESFVDADLGKAVVVVNRIDGSSIEKELSLTCVIEATSENVTITSAGTKYLQDASNGDRLSSQIKADSITKQELALADAKLEISEKSLSKAQDLQVFTLENRDIPALDQGMVNVTKGDVAAYRFLPHGIKFDKANDLSIAYDKSKIPEGLTEDDVRTYFFDDETARWIQLDRTEVVSSAGVIVSKTDHFTDMINAVVQVPDAPETQAFGTTQLKDLKAANPGAAVNLIQAPQANSMGDMRTGYPIELPGGRQGMAPGLGVQYSSAAGNGWMGLGWNLSLPSVSLDTRWGVPRYDENLETETYAISGQQLAPVAHRATPVARTAEKIFNPRVEGSFNKIIRHGTNPTNYWWEVINKDGTRNYFGGNPTSDSIAAATLTTAEGNIANWALTQTVDTYGNTVTYDYAKISDTGVGNNTGSVAGYQLYIQNINYTGHNGAEGAYNVSFIRDRDLGEARRADVMIDARNGFKQVTADLLRKVEIKYQAESVRSYEFTYKTGAFHKTLLDTVKQYDADGVLFNEHTLSYFDDIRDASGNYVAFANEESWNMSGGASGLSAAGATASTQAADSNSIAALQGATVTSGSEGSSSASNATAAITTSNASTTNTASSTSSSTSNTSEIAELDNVRLWEAPFDGIISINAPVNLIEDTSSLRQAYTFADGVRVAIQKNANELWSNTISATDYSAKSPTGIESVSVSAGDLVLFRVQSLSDGAFDSVNWDPEITYTDKDLPTYDANHLDIYHYQASSDFIQNGSIATLPINGEVKIEGQFVKPVTSDNVTLEVIKTTAEGVETSLFSQSYSAATAANELLLIENVEVEATDILSASLTSSTNIDWNALQLQPIVEYTQSTEAIVDAQNEALYSYTLTPSKSVFGNTVQNTFSWNASNAGDITITPVLPTDLTGSGNITFAIKGDNQLFHSQTINVVDGAATPEAVTLTVAQNQQLFIEYYYGSTFDGSTVASWTPNVTVDNATTSETLDAGAYAVNNDNGLSNQYRQWGEYQYVNTGSFTEVIDVTQLSVSESTVNGSNSNTLATTGSTQASQGNLQNYNQFIAAQVASASAQPNGIIGAQSSDSALAAAALTTAGGGPSAISGTTSEGSGKHLAITFGLFDFNLACKSFTIGVKKGSSKSSNDGILSLVDIDGDSLADKVLISGGVLGYQKNLSGPDEDASFADFQAFSGASAFSHGKSKSSNSGFEANLGGCSALQVSIATNSGNGSSVTDIYFSDVNGDGLTDIVDNGRVLYNQRTNSSIPSFVSVSSNTPNPVDETGSLASDGWVETDPAVLEALIDANPLHDTVRVWQAPFDGIVAINAPVNLVENTSVERQDYTTADGVRVAIQHASNELWTTTITEEDYVVKSPAGVSAVAVSKGDRIYFRVQSINDGAYDTVAWNPSIVYTNKAPETDANGLNVYSTKASDEYLISGNSVSMPIEGTVDITSTFTKPITSDFVAASVVKTDSTGTDTVVWTQIFPTSAATLAVNLTQSVSSGDSYRFDIMSDTNVNWAGIDWQPVLTYSAATDPAINITDSTGAPLLTFKSAPTITAYSEQLRQTTRWVANDAGTVSITPQITSTLGAESGNIVFTIKKENQLLSKQSLSVSNGVVTSSIMTENISVVAGDTLFIEYHLNNAVLAAELSNTANIQVNFLGLSTTLVAGIYTLVDDYLFGPMYRNWGQFVYNGNRTRATQAIVEADLVLDPALTQAPDLLDPSSAYDPAQSILIIMAAIAENGSWQGYDDLTRVYPTMQSSSRFGLDDLSPSSPIPTATASSSSGGGSIRAINKMSEYNSDSSSLGLGGGPVGGNLTQSDQTVNTITDFSDMNGDRYPDIIGVSQIQYTTMLGSLESVTTANSTGVVNQSSAESSGISLGGSFGNGSGSKHPTASMGIREQIFHASSSEPNLGISGNTNSTTDMAHFSWRDINADGLPDRVFNDGTAQLNLGYSFTDAENWGFADIKLGKSSATDLGLGINIGAMSIGAGLSTSNADTQQIHTLFDVNGDGLLDETYVDGSAVTVRLNTGNSFGAPIDWAGATAIHHSENSTDSVSAYFTACIPLVPITSKPFFLFKLCINPGGNSNDSEGKETHVINDINGDGYPDVLTSGSEDQLTAKKSTIGRTNLLKKVERPMGASFTVDYTRKGNTFANPHNRWVLDTVTVNDGFAGDGADTMKQQYTYSDGYYDRREREFYGFAKVVVSDLDTQNADALYRTVETDYINDNYYEKGLSSHSVMKDALGALYSETFNHYDVEDIYSNALLVGADKKNDFTAAFPQLIRTEQFFYEGTATAGKQTEMEYTYDDYGNVLTQVDYGDTGPADDWTASIVYHPDNGSYIVAAPQSITLTDTTGAVLRLREADINAQGKVEEVRIDAGNGAILTTNMTYDVYGNLATLTRPPNLQGQRYQLTYTMDDSVQTYVKSVVDSFGYTSSNTHDFRFGAVLSNTDINTQEIKFTVDAKGRITTVTGPYELLSGDTTITYSYDPDATIPVATTTHFDEGRTDTIDTVTFMDGLKRVIQTKKDTEIDNAQTGTGTAMMVVSGRVLFDAFGRDTTGYYPVEESLGNATNFNPAFDTIAPTQKAYDVLDRITQTTLPDLNTLSNSYGFDADRNGVTQFVTQSTDANGNQTESYTDVRNRTTTVKQHNAISGHADVLTSYQYSAINELLEVKDDKDNVTSVTYDQAGRRITIDSPDMGLTETVYDNASNVVEKITANLRAQGLSISYSHDFERLAAINYPNNAQNNVTYTYGATGAANNGAGRLTNVVDASGNESYQYGALGEITRTIRTITTLTGRLPKSYQTDYRYDSWNRLRELTYADAEKVTHQYDSGGSLKSMTGVKGAHVYNYLKALTYDKFGQRVYLKYGNDTETKYSYEPERRRLDALQTNNSNRVFQDNSYGYDAMSNILNVSNAASVAGTTNFGGTTEQNFTYDNLYQLKTANGNWENRQGHQERYSLDMQYDSIHNITHKNQLHERTANDSNWLTEKKTSYDWAYDYDAAQPHASSHIGNRTFAYDANGNQTGWDNDDNGTRRNITWDEENRISEIKDNGQTNTYIYDAGGDRVIKRGQQGETAYVNSYLVVRNGATATKHYFIGSQRITTKVMENEAQTLIIPTASLNQTLNNYVATGTVNEAANDAVNEPTILVFALRTVLDTLVPAAHAAPGGNGNGNGNGANNGNGGNSTGTGNGNTLTQAEAEAAVAAAEQALADAQANLAPAEAAVTTAQAGVDSAQAVADAAQADYDAADAAWRAAKGNAKKAAKDARDAAQAALNAANAALSNAENALSTAQNNLSDAQAAITNAETDLADAQAVLDEIINGGGDTGTGGTDQADAEAAVAAAEQAVADAQAALDALIASGTATQAEIDAANQVLAQAQSDLITAEAVLESIVNSGGTNINFEAKQYYYHGDHLGSSSYITDIDGEVYEHLEYFPFGETWAHEHGNTQRTPYWFTGKELDEATGLYYFGARYYDPRTSVWQSPDPILGQYLNGEGNGGAYNPVNLSLYTYTWNNPIKLVDPDGKKPDASRFTNISRIIKGAPFSHIKWKGIASRNNTNYKLQNSHMMSKLSKFYKNRSRYIYTEKRGPLDLRHFFAAAAESIDHGKQNAIDKGEMMENAQRLLPESTGWGASADDYEDRPSNELGAEFGQIIKNSKTPQDVKMKLSAFMKSLDAKDKLPNYLVPNLGNVPDTKKNHLGNSLREFHNSITPLKVAP